MVATVTPFDARGRVDLPRLRAHVLWLVACGVQGFVPTGTTGEFLYMTDREREAVHRTVIDAARGKPVYPCCWDPSQHTTAYLCEAAREQGAAGVMMPPPLYYNVGESTVEAWYRSVNEAARLPLIGYHDPKHLQTPITSGLYLRLRAQGVLQGLQDCSRDIYRLQRLADADPGAVYGGGDRVLGKMHEIRGLGGFISSIANVWPTFSMRVFRGEEPELADALLERVTRVRRAGGLRALKALLGMGCRMPMIAPPRELIDALPERERI